MKFRSVVLLIFGILVASLGVTYGAVKASKMLYEMYPLPQPKCYTVKEHPMKGTFEHEVKRTD